MTSGSVTTARSRFAERTRFGFNKIFSSFPTRDSRPPIASNPFCSFPLRAPAHSRDRQPLPLCFFPYSPHVFLYFKRSCDPLTGSHSFFVYSHRICFYLCYFAFCKLSQCCKSFCIVNCHVSQNLRFSSTPASFRPYINLL